MLQYCIYFLQLEYLAYGLYSEDILIFANINLYKTFCKNVILREHLLVSIKYSVVSHHSNVLVTVFGIFNRYSFCNEVILGVGILNIWQNLYLM